MISYIVIFNEPRVAIKHKTKYEIWSICRIDCGFNRITLKEEYHKYKQLKKK